MVSKPLIGLKVKSVQSFQPNEYITYFKGPAVGGTPRLDPRGGFETTSNDYEITIISPIFAEATPGFGKFKIEVKIENKRNQESKLNVCCLYVGLTRPGVYFKNELQLMKQYKSVKIGPMSSITVVFEKSLRSYHPETLGEIIVSIVGSGVVRSTPLKSQFHPESDG